MFAPANTRISTCSRCGAAFNSSPRRPRSYCSDACRQAAYRERAVDQDADYRPSENNAPATKSPENSSTISTAEFRNKHTPSIPLNLLGGHRWPDVDPAMGGIVKVVIDTEIGCGRVTIVSPDGVTVTVIRKNELARRR
jgi:hypothetical protein